MKKRHSIELKTTFQKWLCDRCFLNWIQIQQKHQEEKKKRISNLLVLQLTYNSKTIAQYVWIEWSKSLEVHVLHKF